MIAENRGQWFYTNNLSYTFVGQQKEQQLVGGWATPLKNMSSSIGMMTFPTEWENKKLMATKPPTSFRLHARENAIRTFLGPAYALQRRHRLDTSLLVLNADATFGCP